MYMEGHGYIRRVSAESDGITSVMERQIRREWQNSLIPLPEKVFGTRTVPTSLLYIP